MSSVSISTQYMFMVTTGPAGSQDMNTFYCYSQNGMSDALASQIVEALRGIVPPAGTAIQCTVVKQAATTTEYATDYTTNPINFT